MLNNFSIAQNKTPYALPNSRQMQIVDSFTKSSGKRHGMNSGLALNPSESAVGRGQGIATHRRQSGLFQLTIQFYYECARLPSGLSIHRHPRLHSLAL